MTGRVWCLTCGREAEDPVPGLSPGTLLVLCPDRMTTSGTARGCGRVPGTDDPGSVAMVARKRTYMKHLRRHGRRELPSETCPTCRELYDQWVGSRA